MQLMLTAAVAVFREFQAARIVTPILLGDVIAALALGADQCNMCSNVFLRHVKSQPLYPSV